MPYIIDGHNLIGKRGNLGEAGCEDELARVIRGFCFKREKRATLVFDGKSFHSDQSGPLTVKFCDEGYSADDLIKYMIENEPNKQGIIVVSSDNDIRSFADERGARVLKSEEFNEILEEKNEPPEDEDSSRGELSDEEAKEWAKWFKKSIKQ